MSLFALLLILYYNLNIRFLYGVIVDNVKQCPQAENPFVVVKLEISWRKSGRTVVKLVA